MTASTAIDVCICTIDRASLDDTIASVCGQQLPDGTTLRIIVTDNSVDGAAQVRVSEWQRRQSVPIEYVHAPALNISIARNACLDAARGSYLVFIDDDEIAPASWLAELIENAEAFDVIFGPVCAVYDRDTAPAWMVAGDFHSTRIGARDQPSKGYTGNVLIDRQFVARHQLRFDTALGQVGGEDTLFFLAAHEAGGRFGYSPNAIVTEPVPVDRARFAWLAKRQFRAGQIYEFALRQNRGRTRGVILAIAKSAVSAGMAALCVFSAQKRATHALRAIFHAGVVAAALGAPLYREYAPKAEITGNAG